MVDEDVRDVLIIGGGPAGSTAATFLSRQGHKVTLLEKEQFPRDHVGESLLPFCHKLFSEIGVLDEMKASHVRKPGVRFVDRDGATFTTWCFDRVIKDETYLSFQVNRADFDLMLLENSRKNGAEILQRHKVEKVELDNPDGIVRLRASGPEGVRHFSSRFLLDCSGRNAFLASGFSQRKKFAELDRTALWTHYKGGQLRGGLEEGLSLIIYVGGEKKGWIWIFPLGPGWLTVGVVLNNDYIRNQKAKFETEGSSNWQQSLFDQELGYSAFAQRVIEGHSATMPLLIEGDYSYFSENKYGKNWAMIGDAGTFIDPIFSSGVYLAMNSARLVSKALDTVLKSNGEEGKAAMDEVYRKIMGAYKLIFKLIMFFYKADALNFAQMESASSLIVEEHRDAMAVGHYLLAGDFFERYDDYGRIIDLFQNERLYESYKRMVLNRPDFQASSCNTDPEVIFHGLKSHTL